jgi:NTE family protein
MPDHKQIELALQGGGAHGAFTWGVLDRVLEDGRIEISALSGTSAGAMNAVAVADGLTRGGRDGARESLARFWRAVSDAARFSPVRRGPLDVLLGRWSLDSSPGYVAMDLLSRLASPYDLNLFDVNPLRDVVAAEIDFDRVNGCDAAKVFVAATNVRTGLPRVFRQGEITIDAVMASACLPSMFKAVEIEGEAYWDGGFMGNPVLFPLVDESDCRDLVIVQINPIRRDTLPTSAADILNRMNEITFNSSLIKELRTITLLRQVIEAEGLERERYRDMRLHRIGGEGLEHLSVSSKMNAEWAFLTHLRDLGRDVADRWLAENFDALCVRSTFDPASLFAAAVRDPEAPRGGAAAGDVPRVAAAVAVPASGPASEPRAAEPALKAPVAAADPVPVTRAARAAANPAPTPTAPRAAADPAPVPRAARAAADPAPVPRVPRAAADPAPVPKAARAAADPAPTPKAPRATPQRTPKARGRRSGGAA